MWSDRFGYCFRYCWGLQREERLGWWPVKLFSKNSNVCHHNPPTLHFYRQTDRQTDNLPWQYRAISYASRSKNGDIILLSIYIPYINHFKSAFTGTLSSTSAMWLLLLSFIYATADEADAYMFYRCFYVAAKATYSFASWQNRLFGGFFGPSSVKRGRTHIVLGWNM